MEISAYPRPAWQSGTCSCNGFAAAIVFVILSGLPFSSRAQEVLAEPPEAAQLPQTEYLAPPLLDQMLAPIALYPDALLSQILMASTYPLEVIEAYRWVSDPYNSALKGSALETALEAQDWDPSVKSLVPFPDILKTMNDKLGWMQQLGNAFLSHPQDVMDAVQRLRTQAAAAGNLKPTEQQRVVTVERTIIIQQARPEVVYVPVYDPYVIYGGWAWPDYPPVYFDPFPRYGLRVGMFSWFSFGVVSLYWGWNDFDWHHHHIHIDRDRYNRFRSHHGRPHHARDSWEHDPYHRRGVAYADPGIRARFRPNPVGAPASRRDYRGYPPSVARADQPGSQPPGAAPTRPPQTAQPTPPATPERPARDRTDIDQRAKPGDATGRDQRTPPSVSAPPEQPTTTDRRTREPRVNEPRAAVEPDSRTTRSRVPEARATVEPESHTRTPRATESPSARQQRETTPRIAPARTETHVPPAFEDYSSGDSVRAAIERTRSSRQSSTPEPTARSRDTRPDRQERSKADDRQKRQR